jgi:hypothetical protein
MKRAAALAGLVLLASGWSSAASSVRVVLDDRMKARPIEGYVWYVGLDGARPRHGASVVLRGKAGRHVLVSYIRDCDGNCGFLDPPGKRCSRALTLGGAPRSATVQLRDSGCRIVLR